MKKIIDFWNRDIINKLIILISSLLVAGALAFIFMLFNVPEWKSLGDALSSILPGSAASNSEDALEATPSATNTALPFNLTVPPTAGIIDIQPIFPTAAIIPSLTPELLAQIPTASETPAVSPGTDCIPGNTPQTGKAVSVLDGNTIKALIDGLVYVVRYIGVSAPQDTVNGEKARLENVNLVFGKDIVLIVDQSDKDANGRLLRYVLVDDTFVNFKLIQLGLGSALDTPPDSACYQVFKQAEKSAAGAPISGSTPTQIPTP